MKSVPSVVTGELTVKNPEFAARHGYLHLKDPSLDNQTQFSQVDTRQDSLFGAFNYQVPTSTPPPYQPPHLPHHLGHHALGGVVPAQNLQGGVVPPHYIQTHNSRLATHV